ncbi:MAG: glycosyltransferase family 2 protein [Planctomycetes bacterium]|nr:glycosyltransferase family 2 protein [Planctomycetota bacterium]
MQNNRPLVSLIVISFNEIDSIGDCLNALLQQTYPNYEVIVYDNASSDGTPDYISERFPQVRLARGSENLGFGGANNEAAKMTRGKYIGFVNDDAYVSPGWLEPLVDLLENDPTVGCAGAELMCAEKRDVVLCHGNSIHLSGIAYVRDRGQVTKPAPPMEVGGISGAAFLINREFFLEMGGFESLFFLYYEDTDLSLRIRLLGKRCVVVPGAMVYHNCESRFGIQKLFFLERNRYLSLFTLMSVSMLFLMFPSMLLFEFFAWGYCLLRGKESLSSKVKAWKAIYEYRHWIKERRRKYAQSKVSTTYLLHAFTPFVHVDYVQAHKFFGFISLIVGYLVAIPSFLLIGFINRVLNRWLKPPL